MNYRTIGIDIGATKTRIGVVQDAQVIKEADFPTSSTASKQQILDELSAGIIEVAGGDFYGIGIGVPGLVDEENGILFDLLNIPSFKEVHLKDHLERQFNKPVRVTNDANVFAMGEKMFGEGQPYKNLVGITLGSGFGCGIIIHDQLYSGAYSSAGEIGSIPYLDGIIEDYCSGKFFKRNGISGNEVFKGAQAGDEAALLLFEKFGEHLGSAIKLILNVLSPQAILLGGSISKAFPFFEASLQNTINSFPFKKVREQLIVKPSNTSNIALLGAAALILAETPKPVDY
ncbi:ROK family protein [Salinimicrobium tongyeongense]|jgi:glucokinase|uniref:ROK family protein n=1 Tax=Salinimicrobium tongyeongense TaxID=2809707 RepID=A0ABY6NUR6_9FLAO|nr:ROK family protein [Salinimicrobium tongyeongense]UZH56667.1 ROK family protein [Salinimicrobium tongyeongense]